MRTKHSLGERFFAILLVSLLVGNMAACTGRTLSPRDLHRSRGAISP